MKMQRVKPSGLHMVLVGYGALYLVFVLLATVPATRGSIIAARHPESVRLELELVQLAFMLYAVACVAAWVSRPVTGLALLVWYGLLVWLDAFSARYGGGGGGLGPVLGFPILLAALWVLVSWLRGALSRNDVQPAA